MSSITWSDPSTYPWTASGTEPRGGVASTPAGRNAGATGANSPSWSGVQPAPMTTPSAGPTVNGPAGVSRTLAWAVVISGSYVVGRERRVTPTGTGGRRPATAARRRRGPPRRRADWGGPGGARRAG